MITEHILPLSNMSDEELLSYLYTTNQNTKTQMELELATRLEHALDELRKPPTKSGLFDGIDP